MTDNAAERSRSLRPIVVSVLAVAVAGAIAFGISQLVGGGSGSDDTVATTDAAADGDTTQDESSSEGSSGSGEPVGQVLPEPMAGQAAIDALGDKIEFVAQRNGKTVDDLKALLLRDSTAHINTSGFVVYLDTFGNTVEPSGGEG